MAEAKTGIGNVPVVGFAQAFVDLSTSESHQATCQASGRLIGPVGPRQIAVVHMHIMGLCGRPVLLLVFHGRLWIQLLLLLQAPDPAARVPVWGAPA